MITARVTMTPAQLARTLEELADELDQHPTGRDFVARRLHNLTRDLRAGHLAVKP